MAQDQTERGLTYGEMACGVTFNPSGDIQVTSIKAAFAALVDQLHDLKEKSVSPEKKRMYSVAITEAQSAQMWAVKAVTWKY